MVFHSYPFIFIFLPVVVAGFYLLARNGNRLPFTWLTLASLCFYGSWDYRYLPILLASISINYLACRWLLATSQAKQPWRLAVSLSFNLTLLGFFKYVNFFITTINDVSGSHLSLLNILLPIGVSFFTFTQIAVLVDAYHGRIERMTFADYCLFASFFPSIVSGPILRHQELLPQFAPTRDFRLNPENIAIGISIFAFGLAKKLLIADTLGATTWPLLAADNPKFLHAWLGMLAYTMRLYFDFSGYSDMAIGVSRLFGLRIPINFHSPYKAVSVSDFWQRWHISLSQFLRNYLYIPLGGNRQGQLMRYRNLMLTMLLGGLWHGANWTFVVWGGLHGLYLCLQHGWRSLMKDRDRQPSALSTVAGRVLTFVAVMVAWVFFRASDMKSAVAVLTGMAGLNGISGITALDWQAYGILLASTIIAFWLPNTNELFLAGDGKKTEDGTASSIFPSLWSPNLSWGIAIGCIFALSFLSMYKAKDFIYAQF
jgi:D-alanyl-lipoteichoic acid acyltransferase DltB (MBOAT superfamily)